MKKKKLLLPLAIMSLSCGLAVGMLSGCGGDEHVHDYTKWEHDESGHWQVCVEDNEKSEKKPHAYGADGKCECGAEKTVVSTEVGTASGKVKLLKLGKYVEDYSGVTLDTGDDDGIEIDYDSKTGEFSITNARVGKSYTLSISKSGYSTYTTTLEVVKGENSVVGGTKGCVLQYDAFTHAMHVGDDWTGNYGTPNKIDKSHVNDAENPYFTIGEGAGDFYVYSTDSYDTVTASVLYHDGLTWGVNDAERGNQGIRLVFEDGKAAMIRIEKLQNGKFKAQWIGGTNYDWEEQPVLTDWDFGSDEAHFNPFSAELEAQYKDTGVELKLVRNGSVVYAYVNGEKAGEQILPAEYATQKCRVALAAGHVNGGQKIPFSISETLPESTFDSAITLSTGTLPQGVEVSLDKKEGYKIGDLITLSVKLPQEGCVVKAITLGNTSLLDALEDGKVSFVLTEKTNTLTVAVEKIQTVNLTDVSVIGKKYDVAGSSLKDGTAVTLKGQGGLKDIEITVTDGKFSKNNVAQGTYTAIAEGYLPAEVVVGANGIQGGITLQYDGFEMLPPNYDREITDFSQVNDGIIKVNGRGGQSLDIVTKESYTDVAVTINVKDSVAGVVQGIVLKFEDDKYVLLNFKKDQTLIQYRNESWGMKSVFGDTWIEHNITTADIDAFNSASGIDLTLVRKGGMLYAFLGGRFIAADALPEGYETMKAQVGFFAWDVKANASWNFEITKTLPALTSTVALTKNIPDGAQGVNVSLDKTSCTLGETVTLSITLPEEGYSVSAITVNGKSMLDQLKDGKLTLSAMSAEYEIAVTVVEGRLTNIEAQVSGKKYDVKGNTLADGTVVTLKGQGGLSDVTLTITNGKIKAENVVQGTYTAQTQGYRDVEVTVGENGIENPIVFEYDGFEIAFWDGEVHNFANTNDEQSKIGCDNKTLNVLTKESYGDVSVSLTVKDANSRNGNDVQGIWLKFEDGKYLILRSAIYDNSYRLTYLSDSLWGANTWLQNEINLYFFNSSETEAIRGDGIELQLVRNGGKLYTFLGGAFVHSYELPEGYGTQKAQVGFWDFDSAANAVWDFKITKTLPALTATLTTGTTANGKVEGIPENAVMLGDMITVTLTPNAGYILKSLKVGDKDVTGAVTFGENNVGTYTFAAAGNASVVAEFESATYGNLNTAISGLKGTDAIALNGTKVTLVNAKKNYEITVEGGKLTQTNVLTGEYTLTAEGYVAQTVTVTENGIANAIVLVYNIFTAAPATADLTKLNEGKVIATGNGGVDLETKDKYVNITAEAKFTVPDYSGRRYGIALVFDDGKNFRVDFAVQDNGNNILQQTNWNSMMFNWEWVDFPEGYFAERNNNYTEAEIRNEFMAKGLTYKLERDGATVKLYINGVLMKTYTLPEEYANQEARLKFIFDSNGTDGTAGFTFDITVPEDSGKN